jgi:hypothetical protein
MVTEGRSGPPSAFWRHCEVEEAPRSWTTNFTLEENMKVDVDNLYLPMVEFLCAESDKLEALPIEERQDALNTMIFGIARTIGNMLAAQENPRGAVRSFMLELIEEAKRASS